MNGQAVFTAESRSKAADSLPAPELSVVMPVHNEAERLREVIDSWVRELRGLAIDFRILALDDGSTDASPAILEACASHYPELRLIRHFNRGHGPTIHLGYAQASGRWVFQTDSDLEVSADQFALLWHQRDDFDLVVGRRVGRDVGPARNLVSASCRRMVTRLFGSGAEDVNSPFRLIRRSFLTACLERIPAETFAPNLLVTGFALSGGHRYEEVDVKWHRRSHGKGLSLTPSILLRLLAAAYQTWKASRTALPRPR